MEWKDYQTKGQEPIGCKYKDISIGSAACQECEDCYGHDKEHKRVKCLLYHLESLYGISYPTESVTCEI